MEAKRTKILFETERKAENFIRFNSAEIAEQSGYSPVRSYYCIVCDGWHVTSVKDAGKIPDRAAAVVEEFKKAKQLKAEAKERRSALRKEWRDKQEEVLSRIRQNVLTIERQMAISGDALSLRQKVDQALAEVRGVYLTGQLKRQQKEIEQKLVNMKRRLG